MTAGLATPVSLRDGEVVLRPVDGGVAELLVAASHDAEITAWTQVPEGLSMLDAGLVAAGWAGSHSTVRLQVCLPDLAPAGMVTVWMNGEGQAEVGYWLLEAVRGRGVARRAVRLLCDWAFATSALDRLELATLPGNTASQKVAMACGFQRAGSVRRDVKGVTRTLLLWELIRSEEGNPVVQRAATGM